MTAAALRALILGMALVLVSSACATSPDTEAPTAVAVRDEVSLGPRLRELVVDSPAVGRQVRVRLLLPEGFAAEPDRRWPVLLLLHGCCDGYDSWTRFTDIEEWPELAGTLVAMPDGGVAGFYSDWLRGPAWETFHTAELLDLLREQWRAGEYRAVAGLSMGGLGAMGYAARHPGTFQAAASFSGILHTGYGDRADGVLGLVAEQGEAPLDLWGPAGSPGWATHNPFDLAAELRGVELFVSTGDGTPGPLDTPTVPADAFAIERDLAAESDAFVARLDELGIPVTYDRYGPGSHSWPYWARALEAAMPVLLE